MPTETSNLKELLTSGIKIQGKLRSGLSFICKINQVRGDYLVITNLEVADLTTGDMSTPVTNETFLSLKAIDYFNKMNS